MSKIIERLEHKATSLESRAIDANVVELRVFGIVERFLPLVDVTERIFGVTPIVLPGVPDLGEGPYLVFRYGFLYR